MVRRTLWIEEASCQKSKEEKGRFGFGDQILVLLPHLTKSVHLLELTCISLLLKWGQGKFPTHGVKCLLHDSCARGSENRTRHKLVFPECPWYHIMFTHNPQTHRIKLSSHQLVTAWKETPFKVFYILYLSNNGSYCCYNKESMLSVYEKILSKVLKILMKLNSLINVQMILLNCIKLYVSCIYMYII